jgi:hypothetical protein
MTNEEREDLEKELRVIWEQCLIARDAGQTGMEYVSKLKAKLVSQQLVQLKKQAQEKGVQI